MRRPCRSAQHHLRSNTNMTRSILKAMLLKPAVKAFTGLLAEFRGRAFLCSQTEAKCLLTHLSDLEGDFDQQFPGFPEETDSYASWSAAMRRGVRDEFLKQILVRLMGEYEATPHDRIVVNPACFIGRHTRDLARRLEDCQVLGTDIFPPSNWIYQHLLRNRNPQNYSFVKDNIFAPKLTVHPTAVVFFGACGSVSDAIMDYAIHLKSPFLLCRTCCWDNIAGNTRIHKMPTALNRFVRLKNLFYRKVKHSKKLHEHYFSERYNPKYYPRSKAVKNYCSSDDFLEMSYFSVDSSLCRTLIDLDRYLRLVEEGYRVWYKAEVFIAKKVQSAER